MTIIKNEKYLGNLLINNDKHLLTEREAADFLGVTSRCLQAWRYRGGGPKFVRISSRCIRYRKSDLVEWVEERLRSSTSDVGRGVD
ncbi:MAG: helix-turn-helix domain-containing protein [Deltaproteobacteria bacterium]|nr:helix-turn-helix domain-containing protein [Deltaproteobacteria bacterium]